MSKNCPECEQFMALLDCRDRRIRELEIECEIWKKQAIAGVHAVAAFQAELADLPNRISMLEAKIKATKK